MKKISKKYLSWLSAFVFLQAFAFFMASSAFGRGQYGSGDPECQKPGQEDSYVLAVSWQPAFCMSHSRYPECKTDDPNSYQASHFTLHGLWPNKNSCRTNYGFCGKEKERARFQEYPEVPMSRATREMLGKYMPGAASGSDLQRHEWYKHGTCQTTWNADGYFNTAIRLLEEFNTAASPFMSENLGKKVNAQSFFTVIDNAFGNGAHRKLQILCNRQGYLTDIYVQLPKSIELNLSLKELIRQAKPAFRNTCGPAFKIDPIGQ